MIAAFNRACLLVILTVFAAVICGCSGLYYDAMEQIGFPKREILADRVEAAGEAQSGAQEQFASALEQFESVVNVPDTELKKAYENLESAWQDSRTAAGRVSDRIDSVESVANALFNEWEEELGRYENQELRQVSAQRLESTREQYSQMITVMHRAEESMQPVLEKFEDNVLFLKHNLNAQAIGALQSEFTSLEGDINELIEQMNQSIESSNRFVSDLRS